MDMPIYRVINKSDIDGVLTLMDEMKPNIGGSRDPSLYSAMCQEALTDKRVVIVVGEEDSKIIGFLLAVIDRNRWRMSVICRHPWIVIKMIGDRALNKLKKRFIEEEPEKRDIENNRQDISRYINPAATTKSWKDSSPEIAKLLFICVREGDRRKRVAHGLFRSMMDALAERGVKRADAIVLLQNMPSIRFSHGIGFNMYIQDGHIFQTKDIG
jgi:hypothetical protein